MADIFDKMVAGINKGVATVGVGSKAMVEKAKVNSIINNLEKEKKQLAELLGIKVYDLRAQDADITAEDVEGFVSEIGKRNQLIEEQKQQLRRIELETSMVTGAQQQYAAGPSACKCGHANVQGAKFCAGCGSPL